MANMALDKLRDGLSLGAAADELRARGEARHAALRLQFASQLKRMRWQHEFEADEVACALLARLRVPPEQWQAGLQAAAAHGLWMQEWELQYRRCLLLQRQMAAAGARILAPLGRGRPDYARVAQLDSAVKAGDIDAAMQLHRPEAAAVQAQAHSQGSDQGASGVESKGGSPGALGKWLGPALEEGPDACPDAITRTALADVMDSHPPVTTRLARIQQLSGQVPMLLRSTAPPVAVGGRCSPASVAEQVAERLAEDLLRSSIPIRGAADPSAKGGAAAVP